MRRGKIEIAVGLALLVCVNVALIAMYRSSRKEPLKPQAPDVAHHVEDFVAEHRERQRAIIQSIKSESIEQLVESLADDSHVRYPGILTGLDDAQLCWPYVLSNRRAIRLLAVSRDQDAAARAALIRKAYDFTFETHKQAIERVIASYKDPSNPKNSQSLTGSRIGVCCTLFLTADCEGREATARRVDQVREFARDIRQELADSKDLPEMVHFVIGRFLEPDSAFYVSLIMHLTPEEQRAAVLAESGLDQMGSLTTVDLSEWDAEPGTYDLIRQRQLHTSDLGTTDRYAVFAWNGTFHSNIEAQVKVVDSLLKRLNP